MKNQKAVLKHLSFLIAFTAANLDSMAKVIVLDSDETIYELPRSQIKTYIQRGSIDQNLKPIKPVKPGALSDDELVAIPEKYLPPDLKKRQQEIKQKLKAAKKSDSPLATPALKQSQVALPGKESDTVRIKTRSNKMIDIKIENAVWVPPTSATDSAILAPQVKLPEVEVLSTIEITTSGQVKKEIEPGDTREIAEIFGKDKKDKAKAPLQKAFQFYSSKDYATSLTLSLDVLTDKTQSEEARMYARFLVAHSLFQAGFYASATPQLIELLSTKYRRSAVGMISKCLDRTKDEGAANQVLSKLSISQIPEKYQSTFSFHLGRIMLNSGAREAASAAFAKIPADHIRFAEAQYFLGVIASAEVGSSVDVSDWENNKTLTYKARSLYETAMVAARAADQKGDLLNLIRISAARLAYQAKQYNQALYYYSEIDTESPFSRESLYESAWALYKIGEFNRSLGMLHALNTRYYEGRDLAELWILRSLNYLKLCRFDEARIASSEFEKELKIHQPALVDFLKKAKDLKITQPRQILDIKGEAWILRVLASDSVIKKDLATEALVLAEKSKLSNLSLNLRIPDAELRTSTQKVLEQQLDKKLLSVSKALRPYVETRVSDILSEYKAQKDRLDFLKFEIYSQAQKYPNALERPEAKKQIQKAQFLPGVFLKGHEILWRYSGEHWYDELRSYDYFIPTECKSETI